MSEQQRPYLFDAIYRWIIDNGRTPHLLVDASLESVAVPMRLVQDGKIVLNINPSALANFFTEEFGIGFSARFSGHSEQIFIPYAAMIALFSKEDGQGIVFPKEDFKLVERPVLADLKKQSEENKSADNQKPEHRKPSLKIIK